MKSLQQKRAAAIARLARVNRALVQWDEWDATQTILPATRPPGRTSRPGAEGAGGVAKDAVENLAEMALI